MADISIGDKVYISQPGDIRTHKTDTYTVERVKSNQAPYWTLTHDVNGHFIVIDHPVIFVRVDP